MSRTIHVHLEKRTTDAGGVGAVRAEIEAVRALDEIIAMVGTCRNSIQSGNYDTAKMDAKKIEGAGRELVAKIERIAYRIRAGDASGNDRIGFEEAVLRAIERFGVTRSDAQGITDVPDNEAILSRGFVNGEDPNAVARRIMARSRKGATADQSTHGLVLTPMQMISARVEGKTVVSSAGRHATYETEKEAITEVERLHALARKQGVVFNRKGDPMRVTVPDSGKEAA